MGHFQATGTALPLIPQDLASHELLLEDRMVQLKAAQEVQTVSRMRGNILYFFDFLHL